MASFTDLTFIQGLPYDLGGNDVILAQDTTDYIIAYGGDDVVFGLGGDDVIRDLYSLLGGNSGKDTVYCGEGDDTVITSLDGANVYYGGNGVDMLDLSEVKGAIHVDLAGTIAVADNGSLATSFVYSFEKVLGTGYADRIFGDFSNNVFYGFAGNDLMEGSGGNDSLYGGDGNDGLSGGFDDDFIMGDRGDDQIAGGDGNDRVFGGEGNDTVIGGGGNDLIAGNLGNDILLGLTGKDILTGGSNADKFLYMALSESRGAAVDRITDFQHNLDKIDVRLIDAIGGVAGDQAFKFIGDKAFSAAGQISSHYFAASNTTVVNFNTDADAAAEMSINLTGHIHLTSVDFIL